MIWNPTCTCITVNYFASNTDHSKQTSAACIWSIIFINTDYETKTVMKYTMKETTTKQYLILTVNWKQGKETNLLIRMCNYQSTSYCGITRGPCTDMGACTMGHGWICLHHRYRIFLKSHRTVVHGIYFINQILSIVYPASAGIAPSPDVHQSYAPGPCWRFPSHVLPLPLVANLSLTYMELRQKPMMADVISELQCNRLRESISYVYHRTRQMEKMYTMNRQTDSNK